MAHPGWVRASEADSRAAMGASSPGTTARAEDFAGVRQSKSTWALPRSRGDALTGGRARSAHADGRARRRASPPDPGSRPPRGRCVATRHQPQGRGWAVRGAGALGRVRRMGQTPLMREGWTFAWTTHEELARDQAAAWADVSPEERVAAVEIIRQAAFALRGIAPRRMARVSRLSEVTRSPVPDRRGSRARRPRAA
jgi:hypothetical protein